MKILHVVAYVSSDGAYGGPVSVAMAQCGELARRGHSVELVAAAPVNRVRSEQHDGFTLTLFPARWVSRKIGFAGLTSLPLLRYLVRSRFDITHVHLARDLLTLPAALLKMLRRETVVLQTHGMIDRSARRSARLLDWAATRRALRTASAVFALTDAERKELKEIESRARVRQIANGIATRRRTQVAERDRVVLFMARLHPRKRVLAFVDMADLLMRSDPDVVFRIVGPDEGDGDRLNQRLVRTFDSSRIELVGAVDRRGAEEEMLAARVFVLPSVDEVFPMAILEAFASGTPVVCTSSLGIAGECERFGAASVVPPDPASLALAVAKLMDDEDVSEQHVAGGDEFIARKSSIQAIVEELLTVYVRPGEK